MAIHCQQLLLIAPTGDVIISDVKTDTDGSSAFMFSIDVSVITSPALNTSPKHITIPNISTFIQTKITQKFRSQSEICTFVTKVNKERCLAYGFWIHTEINNLHTNIANSQVHYFSALPRLLFFKCYISIIP